MGGEEEEGRGQERDGEEKGDVCMCVCEAGV